jgi:hypothetical protein
MVIQKDVFFVLVRDAQLGMLNIIKTDVKTLKRIKVNGKQYISVKDLNDMLNGYTRKPKKEKTENDVR